MVGEEGEMKKKAQLNSVSEGLIGQIGIAPSPPIFSCRIFIPLHPAPLIHTEYLYPEITRALDGRKENLMPCDQG